MENNFGLKELYDVRLKATYPMMIGNLSFEEGETIIFFNSINLANFEEIKKEVSAKGGFDNRSRVIWSTTKEIQFIFSQGIFSKKYFSLMNNAKLLDKEALSVALTISEILETDSEGKVVLKKAPLEKIYCYDEKGNKIIPIRREGQKLFFKETFKEIFIEYEYLYEKESSIFNIGQNLYEGYLSLEGKTKLKDDKNGHVITGIIKIPKIKIMSKLSLQLGENANPQMGIFSAVGYPVGVRGNTKVSEIIFLNDDIDADIV